MHVFLHAGCGNSPKNRSIKGFGVDSWHEVRMDADPAHNPDILSSLLDMKTVKDASFDAIYTAHSLERLYAHQVGSVLANLLRALKPEGYLALTCMDLRAACELVAQDKLLEPAYDSPAGPVSPLDIIYGFRPALAAGQAQYACRCGFTARALSGTLTQSGFSSVWVRRNKRAFSICAIACKSETGDEEIRELALRHF